MIVIVLNELRFSLVLEGRHSTRASIAKVGEAPLKVCLYIPQKLYHDINRDFSAIKLKPYFPYS